MEFKEKYFERDHIRAQSRSLLEEIRRRVGIHSREFRPSRAALLVLDMQCFFLEPNSHAFVPSAPAILSNIRDLQNRFMNHQRPVIQTRHLNSDENAGMMKHWWKDLIGPEDSLSQITGELQNPLIKEIKKVRYDAFYKTGLQPFLQNRGIDQLVITGVLTHLCVESTARSAFVRDFEVFLAVDGTATYNRGFHLASMLNLAHGFSDLRLSCDIMGAFKTHDQ